jgi:hypothetical protein
MNITENIKSFSDSLTNLYMDNSVSIILGLVLILYIAMASSKVPKFITVLLDNNYLKIALILLIAYVASKDAPLAIILAIALLVTLQKVNKDNVENNTLDTLKATEKFEQVSNIEYPANGLVEPALVASKDVKLPSNNVIGMDKESHALFDPAPEQTLEEQTNHELPKDIPTYVVESIPLYAPSKNSVNDDNFHGNDTSFEYNGPVDSVENGLLLKDVNDEQKNKPSVKVAEQDNCSKYASAYSGAESATL